MIFRTSSSLPGVARTFQISLRYFCPFCPFCPQLSLTGQKSVVAGVAPELQHLPPPYFAAGEAVARGGSFVLKGHSFVPVLRPKSDEAGQGGAQSGRRKSIARPLDSPHNLPQVLAQFPRQSRQNSGKFAGGVQALQDRELWLGNRGIAGDEGDDNNRVLLVSLPITGQRYHTEKAASRRARLT